MFEFDIQILQMIMLEGITGQVHKSNTKNSLITIVCIGMIKFQRAATTTKLVASILMLAFSKDVTQWLHKNMDLNWNYTNFA